jgi:hypothetical protein
MAKYVIETVQIIKRKYYVKVEDPTWAEDSIIMGELEHFSSSYLCEDIISTTKVKKFPKATRNDDMNSAVMVFNSGRNEWDTVARWDLEYNEDEQ